MSVTSQPKIVDVILFISKSSEKCLDVVLFVEQFKIPVKITSLDSKEERDLAANNQRVKITAVPTIVIITDDKQVRMYNGKEKCLRCLEQLKATIQTSTQPTPTPAKGGHLNTASTPDHKEGRKKRRKGKRVDVPDPAEINFVDQVDVALVAKRSLVEEVGEKVEEVGDGDE